MKGTVVLSHGLESGPDATKVTAMAEAAERLGFVSVRPDYRDLDHAHGLGGAGLRLQRLLEVIDRADREAPVILGGSSFGAFISGLASLDRPVAGVFVMALPLSLPGFDRPFDLAPVPAAVVHGWDDELIPARAVIDFCERRRIDLQLVPDSHRLTEFVMPIAERFGAFLGRF